MKNLKQKFEKYLSLGLLVAIGILALIAFAQKCSIESKNDEIQLKNVEIGSYKDSVVIHKSKNGELTAMVKSTEIDKRNLKESLELKDISIKELRRREIKYRDIISVMEAKLESAGKVSIITRDSLIYIKGDSVRATTFSPWTDGRLSISNGLIYNNKLDFKYRYDLSFKIIPTQNRKETVVNIILDDDKNTRITSASSIVVKPKTYLWQKPWITFPAGIIAGYFIFK